MQKMAANKIEFANTLRGLAALSVLISHYFGVFWLYRDAVVGFTHAPVVSELLHPTPWYVKLIQYFACFSWGAFGVGLFFLISGFVIPFSLLKTNMNGFAVNRMFRILPTYAVGLTVTIISVWLCTWYFQQPFPLTFKEIFPHYFPGLHDILHGKNIDGIIWTLEIEVKFYVICALAIYLLQHQSWKVFLIPVILGVVTLCLNNQLARLVALGVTNHKIYSVYMLSTPYLIFMFIGVAFHYFYRKSITPENFIFIIVSLFLLFALSIHTGIYSDSLKNLWSYGFALLVFSFAYANQALFRGNAIVNYFADISYPLYVVHGIAGYVLLTILLDNHYRPIFALLITVSAALGLATIIHKVIELPTQQFGKRMMLKMNNKHQNVVKDELILEGSQEANG